MRPDPATIHADRSGARTGKAVAPSVMSRSTARDQRVKDRRQLPNKKAAGMFACSLLGGNYKRDVFEIKSMTKSRDPAVSQGKQELPMHRAIIIGPHRRERHPARHGGNIRELFRICHALHSFLIEPKVTGRIYCSNSSIYYLKKVAAARFAKQ
jgi:hypothetical protein